MAIIHQVNGQNAPNAVDVMYLKRILSLALTGIIFFLMANLFPLVDIDFFGNVKDVTIVGMIERLLDNGYYIVGIGVMFLILIIPLMVILMYAVIAFLLLTRRGETVTKNLLILLSHLYPWSMVDVFAVSILVALVKLSDNVQFHFGISFWALVLYISIDFYFTKIWKIKNIWRMRNRVFSPKKYWYCETDNAICCPVCDALNRDGKDKKCWQCNYAIQQDPKKSLYRTAAFLMTAIILYFPANIYPILQVKNIFGHTDNTIIGGVILLWDEGSYFVSTVIIVASVFVPILKFIVLLYLLIGTYFHFDGNPKLRHKFYLVTEIIGSWSMVDVFVVSLLTGLVHYNSFNILAGPAATAFVLMVFFTMLSAISFDPRLLENHTQHNSA